MNAMLRLTRTRNRQARPREQLAQLVAQMPNLEALKRLTTHEDLTELRHDFLRLDKKMTVGLLALLTLRLVSNAPSLLDWSLKMVGYALR